MKKIKMTMVLAAAAVVLALSGCAPQENSTVNLSHIESQTAKDLVLEASGFSESAVNFSSVELDEKNGIAYYEVEFTADNKKYSYDVDATTGAILESKVEDDKDAAVTANSGTEKISETEAKNIALAHAGLKASAVTFYRTELDRDDNRQVYEVEFYTGNKEYDYEIDAFSGEILSYDYEIEAYTPAVNTSTSGSTASGNTANSKTITKEEAKKAALDHAGLKESAVSFVKTELDWDDGKKVYEVEFYTTDYKEYDYEIDALTGKVLSYDYDAEHYTPPTGSAISAEKAKEIALAQVPGATAKNIYEFETDRDDGKVEYEGKIVYDGMEYEFEIDGYSGAIRSWESERYDG